MSWDNLCFIWDMWQATTFAQSEWSLTVVQLCGLSVLLLYFLLQSKDILVDSSESLGWEWIVHITGWITELLNMMRIGKSDGKEVAKVKLQAFCNHKVLTGTRCILDSLNLSAISRWNCGLAIGKYNVYQCDERFTLAWYRFCCNKIYPLWSKLPKLLSSSRHYPSIWNFLMHTYI